MGCQFRVCLLELGQKLDQPFGGLSTVCLEARYVRTQSGVVEIDDAHAVLDVSIPISNGFKQTSLGQLLRLRARSLTDENIGLGLLKHLLIKNLRWRVRT